MEYTIKYKIHLKVYRSVIKSNDEATAKYILLGKASNKFNVNCEDIIILSCEESQTQHNKYGMFSDGETLDSLKNIFGIK